MTLPELPEHVTANNYPPVMSWEGFAEWIRVDRGVVKTWVELGHVPTLKIGKRRLINIFALVEQIRETEQ